jgi:lysophospholipase L1-like esterase
VSAGSPRRGRRVLLSLASLALGSIAAFLIGEGLFRILGLKAHEPGRIFRISDGANLQFPGRAGHTVIDLYVSNPRGSFPIDLRDEATREDLIRRRFTRVDEARATNPFGVAFSYNSRGFRDREFVAKPSGTRRLVFVGDSFTEAQGVVESASAARLVEGLLRRKEPSVESWNLGVRGQDFPDLEAQFDAALELSPDAVILGMVLNDADRNRKLTAAWPRVNDWIMVREETRSWAERHSFLIGYVANRYRLFQVSRDTTGWYRALYSDDNREGWMRTRASLQRIRSKCEERGVRFGVVLWPLLVGLEPRVAYPFEAAHAQVRKGVERIGVPFLDLLPTLRGHDPISLQVHPSDLHPNEKAQALVAPVLADFADVRLLGGAPGEAVAK